MDRAGISFALPKLSPRQMKGATGSTWAPQDSPDVGYCARVVPLWQEEGGPGQSSCLPFSLGAPGSHASGIWGASASLGVGGAE